MNRRFVAAVFALLTVVACTQSDLTSPGAQDVQGGPSLAIVDAGHGLDGVDGFWFLPPLAKQVTTEGTFDAGLEPTMSVCEIDLEYEDEDGNPVDPTTLPVADLDQYLCNELAGPFSDPNLPFSVSTENENYAFSWDTSPDQADNLTFFGMDPDRLYRIQIYLGEDRLGYLDVNPQNPSGETPGEDFDNILHAFRLGETLPVKFFLSPQVRCETTNFVDYVDGGEILGGYVMQCAAEGVIDTNGGTVALTPVLYNGQTWPTIVISIPADALPAGVPSAILRMERVDPGAYFTETGEECVPGIYSADGLIPFDAPQFGDCLVVTTEPELPQLELGYFAEVAICIDMDTYLALEAQHVRPQIIRYSDSGIFEGLAMNEPSTDINSPNLCDLYEPAPLPGGTADASGFFPVPDEGGLMRTAALAANTLAGWFGPTPLGAHERDIRLSGSTSGFSNFRWALLGEMDFGDYDGTDFVAADSRTVQIPEGSTAAIPLDLAVRVVDSGGDDGTTGTIEDPDPVAGATVHFYEGASEVASVTTGADGFASYQWAVDAVAGDHVLEARALGLFADAVPDHDFTVPFTGVESVYYTVTVVGPPASAGAVPDTSIVIEGLPGDTYPTPFEVTVYDSNGNPVVGYSVNWQSLCDAVSGCGSVDGDEFTNEEGKAFGTWTFASVPGSNTLQVTIGDVVISWRAIVGCQVTVDGNEATVSGEWDCADADQTFDFFANVSGGDAPAQLKWQTDGENLYFLVKVARPGLDKVNSVRIDFDSDGVTGPSANDDILGFAFDGSIGTAGLDDAYDWYLTSKCVNRSQSSCGAADPTGEQAEGAVNYDAAGGWMVYELSHPISGDQYDLDLTARDVGFFLTLSIGNGAQGNTQVPGFRNYSQWIIPQIGGGS